MASRKNKHRRKARFGTRHIVVVLAGVVVLPLIGWSAIALVSRSGPENNSLTSPTAEPSSHADHHTDPANAPSRDAGHEPVTDDEPDSDDDTDTDTDDGADTDDGPSTRQDPATEQQIADAVQACAIQLTAGQAVATEANTGVGHWNEHIEARTDLLAGRNTDAETRDIWKRTRLAGPQDLTRFAAVLSTYEQLTGCDHLSTLDVPAELQAEVMVCLARAGHTAAVVTAAIAAVGDWEAHLEDMAAHADGHMTSDEAQDTWVEAWENAPANIDAFYEARDELEQAPACSGAGE